MSKRYCSACGLGPHKFSELCRCSTLLILSRSGDRSNLANRGSDPKRRLVPKIEAASGAAFLEEEFFSAYLLLEDDGELLRAIVAYFWWWNTSSFSGGLFSMFFVGDVSSCCGVGAAHRSELALRALSLDRLEEGFWADLQARGIVEIPGGT